MAPVLLFVARLLAAPPGCAAEVAVAKVEAAVAGAESAWGVDEDSFRRGVDAARAALPCVNAPLTPVQASRYHRLEGLAAFLAGDSASVNAAFAAARAADPGATLPEHLVPVGNPVRVAWDAAVPGTATTTAPPPARARLWVDGRQTRAIPADRARLLQLEGDTLTTAWQRPGDPLPTYKVAGEGLRLPLLIGSGALLAGAGVLAALDQGARARALERTPLSDAEREARQATVNQLGAATVAVGVVGAGVGVSAFVVGRW